MSVDRFSDLMRRWNAAGKTDPFWAVLSDPAKRGNKWTVQEFFDTGVREIGDVMAHVDRTGLAKRRNALDFGCGPGRLSQALAEHFENVDGVDISASMIELANRFNRFPDRCRYHVNVAADLRLFADDTFDFIYSNITLQHMDPAYAKGYLREFIRVLEPDGLLVFQLPSTRTRARSKARRYVPGFVAGLYHTLRYRSHPAAAVHGTPKDEVVGLMRSLGADVVEIEPDTAAGSHWESFRYSCRRAAAARTVS
jgi:SAM-dependent methyltransferase